MGPERTLHLPQMQCQVLGCELKQNLHALLRPLRWLLSICVTFHRKLWRQEMAGCCVTHRGGYSCICFYSCFLAFGPLSGDTAVCTPAAEVPED